MLWLIVLVCALALVAAAYGGFRGLAAFRHETGHAWSQIEAQLKQRRELVHEFLGHAAHHFPHSAHLRSAVEQQSLETHELSHCARLESGLTHGVAQILAWLENCPEEFLKHELEPLRDALVKAEEKILFASQYHNAVAKAHNTRIKRFPHSVVARCFGIRRLELFELEPVIEQATQSPISSQ